MALCESMPKPVIAAISGTALAGAFEFALSCDLRIAEDGDYLMDCRRRTLDSFPAPAARKGCHAPSERQPRSCTSSWVFTALHVKPKGRGWCTKPSAARLSIVRWRLRSVSSHTPESVAYIKHLVRNATETPLAQGLALERNLFLKLCITEPALARIRSKRRTSPRRRYRGRSKQRES